MCPCIATIPGENEDSGLDKMLSPITTLDRTKQLLEEAKLREGQ